MDKDSTDKTFRDCMVIGCDAPGHPMICPGDGRYHHHGAIHTHPRTRLALGAWGWLCEGHGILAVAEWETARQEVTS